MPGPVSMDLRRRVVDAYKQGEGSYRGLAARFSVGEKSIRRWVRLEAEQGSLAPSAASRGPAAKIDETGRAAIRMMLEEQCDLTNAELAEQLHERGLASTSASAVSRALGKMGWSRKKNAVGG
jgi:transposase